MSAGLHDEKKRFKTIAGGKTEHRKPTSPAKRITNSTKPHIWVSGPAWSIKIEGRLRESLEDILKVLQSSTDTDLSDVEKQLRGDLEKLLQRSKSSKDKDTE